MRKIIVNEFMTLDGVVQSPSSPTEDPSDGFSHGGWHAPYTVDPMLQQAMTETIQEAGGFLFGRRTYDTFAAYWPTAPAELAMVAEPLNLRPKYVVSSKHTAPAWRNTTVLTGDVRAELEELKRGEGGDLIVFGSTVLVKTLLDHGLVDEFRFVIDPVVVGGGKRVFGQDGVLRHFRLVGSTPTNSGAILATYAIEA